MTTLVRLVEGADGKWRSYLLCSSTACHDTFGDAVAHARDLADSSASADVVVQHLSGAIEPLTSAMAG